MPTKLKVEDHMGKEAGEKLTVRHVYLFPVLMVPYCFVKSIQNLLEFIQRLVRSSETC